MKPAQAISALSQKHPTQKGLVDCVENIINAQKIFAD
jgi:hypothetical protein